jgi:hypothetical protein
VTAIVPTPPPSVVRPKRIRWQSPGPAGHGSRQQECNR